LEIPKSRYPASENFVITPNKNLQDQIKIEFAADQQSFGDSDEDQDQENSFLKKENEVRKLKIDKFDSKSKPKSYLNILKVGVILMAFLIVSIADFLVNYSKESEMDRLLENGKSLTDLKSSINSAYAVLYEGIALKTPNISFDSKNLLDKHLDDIITHNRDLVTMLEEGFASAISEYTENFKSIMFNNMCENFLKTNSSIG
jgi:hypothetical protein